MPAYLNPLRDEILALIGTTWPEVKENGIWRPRELGTEDFDAKARGGGLPLAVLSLTATPSDNWGFGNRVDECQVQVYYVATDETTPDQLISKLELLRTALWPAGGAEALSSGQVLEYPEVTDSPQMEANRYLLARQLPFYCGVVAALVLAGEMG